MVQWCAMPRLQSIINWYTISEKIPPTNETVCVMYRLGDSVGVSTAYLSAENLWMAKERSIFSKGFVTHWGMPEYVNASDVVMFTTATAHKMCGIKRRQFYYWIEHGKISGKRDTTQNRWLFPLTEINRIRAERGLHQFTKDEAIKFWSEL
jgi:hypothetical protein